MVTTNIQDRDQDDTTIQTRPGNSTVKGSDLEDLFDYWFGLLAPENAPEPEKEYKFNTYRKWRFDRAFIREKLAVEIDGGQWAAHGGRHNSDKDREKLNQAACDGWRVLHFSGSMLKNNPAGVVDTIIKALGLKA